MEARTWTAIDVVRDILGKENAVVDANTCTLDKTFIRSGEFPCFGNGKASQWMIDAGWNVKDSPPTIELESIDGIDGYSLAAAAHEANHALLWHRHRDDTYRDEGLTNRLASVWLSRNLSGFRLYAARELILHSNIGYGPN